MVKVSAIVSLLVAVAIPAVQGQCFVRPSLGGSPGNGQGEIPIGDQCFSNADCGTGCCATCNPWGTVLGGICSGLGAAHNDGKQGCGFVSG